ncbi:MAG: hypothetical protein P8163_13475 [Candidatus Thiodiazotropha sp.]
MDVKANSDTRKFSSLRWLFNKNSDANEKQYDQLRKHRRNAIAKICIGVAMGCSAYFLNLLGISIQVGIVLFLFFPIGLFAGFLLAIPQLHAIQEIKQLHRILVTETT